MIKTDIVDRVVEDARIPKPNGTRDRSPRPSHREEVENRTRRKVEFLIQPRRAAGVGWLGRGPIPVCGPLIFPVTRTRPKKWVVRGQEKAPVVAGSCRRPEGFHPLHPRPDQVPSSNR